MDINFQNIRPYEGSRHNGFEELVCQLAHLQKPNDAKTFVRKEGAGGDGGVECYWVLNDHTEICWQAKYFMGGMDDSRWNQIDQSFKKALEKHPNLKKYIVCLPFDRTDSRKKSGTGKVVVSILDKWNAITESWHNLAIEKSRYIEFEFWGKHEIACFLSVDHSLYRGRALYWFDEPILGMETFKSVAARSKNSLGERYTPEFHVELPVAKALDALSSNPDWWQRLATENEKLHEQNEQFLREFFNQDEHFLNQDVFRELREISENIIGKVSHGIKNRDFVHYIDEMKILCSNLQDCKENLLRKEMLDNNDDVNTGTSSYSKKYVAIDNFFYTYRSFSHFLDSKSIKVAAVGAALLHGEAGIGKSHLLCDFSIRRIERNLPTVFLLGQHYEGGNPLQTLRSALDLLNHSNKDVLGALDAAGEAHRTKALVVIDAINEGSHRDDWPNHIRGFLTDMNQYPNIAVLLSCRSSYVDYMIPDNVDENCLIRLQHRGFQGYEHRAAEKYMSKQGISKPSAPILAPEFTNPLFLKTCCKALIENGMTSFPKGLHGLTKLFEFFLKSVERTISIRKKYNPEEEIISEALREFSSKLFPENFSGMPVGEARKFINTYDPNCNRGESLFDELLYEGIISEDMSYQGGKRHPVARFTYERFSDHFIAQKIVDKYDESSINKIFRNNQPLGKILKNKEFHRYEGVFEALSVALAEKFHIELIDLLPVRDKVHIGEWTLDRIFSETIIWRSPESITERSLELLNGLRGHLFRSPAIETLLKLSTEPDHPWNADLLHKNVIDKSLAERDHFWSIQIALGDQIEEDGDSESIVRTIIEWSCFGEIKSIEKERARLCAITLFWFLTTPNRKVRDQATKSLVRLLSVHPDLLPKILHTFHAVNDLYLVERLYAVAYGVMCSIETCPLISEVAGIVYDLVFKNGAPIPHILLRDYARGIIEYALHLNIAPNEIEPIKCRPPYFSDWPIENPSKEDIETIEGDEFSSRIKSSLMGFPGDFGNYTMSCIHRWSHTPLSEPKAKTGYLLKREFAEECLSGDVKRQYLRKIKPKKKEKADFSDLIVKISAIDPKEREEERTQENIFRAKIEKDLNKEQVEYFRWLSGVSDDRPAEFSRKWAQRWTCVRAHELGWQKKLFEEFEQNCSYGRGGGMNDGHLERIGKKYQWIALHELLARLSDNVHWIDRGYSDIEDERYYGPWQMHKRNIDPTIWIRSNAEGHSYDNKTTTWWQRYRFPLESYCDIDAQLKFMWSEKDIPDFSSLLEFSDPKGLGDWFVLNGFWLQHQQEVDTKNAARLDAWFRINSIIIRKDDYKGIRKSIGKINLIDPHTVNVPSTQHQGFLGEYPWHPSCRFMSGWVDNSKDKWGSEVKGKYLVPVSKYEWESGGADHSLDCSLSFYMPASDIIEELGLVRSKNDFGAWQNKHGEVVFLDPSAKEKGPSFALIKKSAFLNWLEENDLEILWLIGGEKLLFNSNHTFYGGLVYNCLARIEDGSLTSSVWFTKEPAEPE